MPKQLEILEDLERIVTLLKEHPQGLDTPELQEALGAIDKKYAQMHPKSIRKRIDALVCGAIPGVEVEKGARRMPHRLIADRRMDTSLALPTAQLIGEEQAFLRLALQSISELPELSDRHYQAIERRFKLDTLNTPYFIESQDAERLDTKEAAIAFLTDAIRGDHPVEFAYLDDSSQERYMVEPYKLIVFDGLWYLFGKDVDEKESSPYKTWRLKYIDEVDVYTDSRHNTTDTAIERVLQKANDADFVVEDLETAEVRSVQVKVWVDDCIADEVRLPGFEKKLADKEGTGYHITCDVSTTEEIDKDIKQWLPHIKVLEPETYKKRFEDEMKVYIQKLSGT